MGNLPIRQLREHWATGQTINQLNVIMKLTKWPTLGLALTALVMMESCGERKTESATSTANPDSMAAVEKGNTPVMGSQGDTTNSSTSGPTQAPPDSGDRGAIVPANVNVKKKQ